MGDHPVFGAVREFYNTVNKEASIHSRVNEEHLSQEANDIFNQLSEEIKKRYFGAGIGIPEKLYGKRILDIGCGSGSLVFMLSKLVGPDGYVIGIDYSDGLIDTAKAQSEYHWKKWGYSKANFEFHVGDAEKLDAFNWGPESFDLIVSNGVFVLLVDKDRGFKHAFDLLKTGGMFYLTDVYVEKEMPENITSNEHLWCGGAGAMRWDKLAPTAVKAGFTTPYLTQAYPVNIAHEEFKVMTEVSRFLCAGWRLFKLPGDKKRGTSRVTYKGNIPGYPSAFPWDINLTFKTGEAVDVDGELVTILAFSYLSDNFDIVDSTADVKTNRNQNPFAYLSRLETEGKKLEPMYTAE